LLSAANAWLLNAKNATLATTINSFFIVYSLFFIVIEKMKGIVLLFKLNATQVELKPAKNRIFSTKIQRFL
jgi:hypothetical protein